MKFNRRSISTALFTFCLSVASTLANAAWELDVERSKLNFISIKNDAVAETHHFGELYGVMSDKGAVELTVELASVETLIDIRNERMRDLLFNIERFPQAKISATIEMDVLSALAGGRSVTMEVPVNLSMHGAQKAMNIPVVASAEGDNIRVLSARPVVVNAADFGLLEGIGALQKIAGLKAIATAVPVTLNLVFTPVSAGS